MGEGVFGSSSGGVNPAGASLTGAGVGVGEPSAAVALMVKVVRVVGLRWVWLGVVKEDWLNGLERVGVKREA
ncbi:hypothetical protein HanRHA438_Chr17g0791231 [Helianthus annuus]|nr:hypothetical protein HanRHA438_Chr17g0791231 [Helianthus annuus]